METEPTSGGAGPPAPPLDLSAEAADTAAVAPMLIRTGTARLEVDSLEVGIARIRALATALGGYVANASVQASPEQVRQATLEMKIPAPRFDEALNGLAPVGTVEAVDVQAQDVGEEYVDIAARLENARRLEERYLRLLETRTGRLDDVLAVERELARVREEIERMEGRLRYLRSRVAISTLSVLLHEPYPLVGRPPGADVLGDAVRQAWRNFLAFVAGFISLLGFLIPLGVVLLVGWWVIRRVRPRRGWRREPPAPPAPRARAAVEDDRKTAEPAHPSA